tara:strand:- start:669 stop:875 length:207 start_codon:yes stop_codon:yes gene_type:complete
MTQKLLPLAAMERLLKKAGAPRVSEQAKTTLKDLLEEHAEKIGAKAWEIAKHSGRKTIKSSDLKIASK